MEEEEIPMMRKSLVKEEENYFGKGEQSSEPIFIRMDKFEDGSKNFEEVKKKVVEIEKMLAGVKQIKEEEEKEIQSWSEEIMQIKEKLGKVDEDIFSKIK